MKLLSLIFIFYFSLIKLYSQEQLDYDFIKVVKVSKHPFLTDHCKRLQTIDDEGNVFDEENLYCDPGSGCNSYIFEASQEYIVIDCNGQWYSINKVTRKIEDIGWKWQNDLPENNIGFYKSVKGAVEYKLVLTNELKKENVYKYKDPKQ